MKVIIGSDKSGFPLKEAIKAHLMEKGHEVEDCGTLDLDNVKPFFVTAKALAPRVQSGEFERASWSAAPARVWKLWPISIRAFTRWSATISMTPGCAALSTTPT